MRKAAEVPPRTTTFAGHTAPEPPISSPGLPLWPPHVRGTGWRMGAGHGTVHVTTIVRPPGVRAQVLSLVDLDDGARVLSRIVGLAPASVCAGLRVHLVWDGEVPVFAVT